jgi:hypothetical protein
MFDWEENQETALEYVGLKKQQGRFNTSFDADLSRAATFDIILCREIVL